MDRKRVCAPDLGHSSSRSGLRLDAPERLALEEAERGLQEAPVNARPDNKSKQTYDVASTKRVGALEQAESACGSSG